MKYIALLRAINVGGNNKVSMAQLKLCLQNQCYQNVQTYINSGNVIFDSNSKDTTKLKTDLEHILKEEFQLPLEVVVVNAEHYKLIIESAPSWWGKEPAWKHNLIFMLEPSNMKEVLAAVGELVPGIEAVHAVEGAIFQSLDFSKFSTTTSGKLASNRIYKKMTIRNHNTAMKLLDLVESDSGQT